jgi:hypothetical protein
MGEIFTENTPCWHVVRFEFTMTFISRMKQMCP